MKELYGYSNCFLHLKEENYNFINKNLIIEFITMLDSIKIAINNHKNTLIGSIEYENSKKNFETVSREYFNRNV